MDDKGPLCGEESENWHHLAQGCEETPWLREELKDHRYSLFCPAMAKAKRHRQRRTPGPIRHIYPGSQRIHSLEGRPQNNPQPVILWPEKLRTRTKRRRRVIAQENRAKSVQNEISDRSKEKLAGVKPRLDPEIRQGMFQDHEERTSNIWLEA